MPENLIKKIIVEKLGVDIDKINPESNLVDDFDADSLDLIEMVIDCEEVFDVTIPDEDYKKIVTFQDMVDCVAGRL